MPLKNPKCLKGYELLKSKCKCRKIKKIPILVGGTGLYFKALTDGLVNIPKIPVNFRNKVRNLHKRIGQKKFFIKLTSYFLKSFK